MYIRRAQERMPSVLPSQVVSRWERRYLPTREVYPTSFCVACGFLLAPGHWHPNIRTFRLFLHLVAAIDIACMLAGCGYTFGRPSQQGLRLQDIGSIVLVR